ncbi:MAG: hypothetical protein JW725_03780 [Candidatus Babeliaceae bacterium]|nr:hypothetical protein [Candidatus Babeliaceae bacterium]
MNKILKGIALLAVSLFFQQAYAALEFAETREEYNDLIDRNDMVVMYIFDLRGKDLAKNPVTNDYSGRWHAVDTVQRIMQKIDKDPYYRNVIFASVNLARGDLEEIRKFCCPAGATDMMLFFYKGKRKARAQIQAAGFTRAKMKSFLQLSKVDDFVSAYNRKVEQQEARRRRTYRRTTCVDCGPRVGFGIGVGPYYDGYWGPRNWWYYDPWYPGWGGGFSIGFGL